MTQKFLLLTPVNWPMAWWNSDSIKMSCPVCGGFSAMLERPEGESPKIACESCGLNGIAAFQRKFGAYNKSTFTAQEISA